MPATARATGEASPIGGVVIARNVVGMHGDTTNPEPVTEPGLEVNLLPQYASAAMRGLPVELRLLRFAVACIFFFTLVYGGMVGYEAYFVFQTELGQYRLRELNNQILGYSDLQTQVAETNTTLVALNDLLANHIYWTNWFQFLEHYTLPKVYFTNFTGSSTGTMNLDGVAESYTTITQQVNAFRAAGELVTAVEVNTATRTSADATVTSADTVSTDETDDTADTNSETTTTVVAAATTPLIHFTISLQVNPQVLLYSSDYAAYE
jgi:hypothetical protein